MKVCETPYCSNKAVGRLCNTCYDRNKRHRNPMRYAYDNLKHNCYRRKGRGWFELTFEEFSQYAYETNYLTGKGRTKTSWSVDREDDTMGYFIGNIKPRTMSNNSRKGSKVLHYDWQTGYATVTNGVISVIDNGNPF